MESQRPKETAGFVHLLTPNYYKIHSFILAMMVNPSEAEDVLQDSIIYMLEHFEEFEPGTDFLAWAVTVAKYMVLTHRKRSKRKQMYLSKMALELVAQENERLLDQIDDRYEALQGCLRKLPQKDLDIIKRRFVREESTTQIADDMRVTANIVYKHFSRIKRVLLTCIHRSIAATGGWS